MLLAIIVTAAALGCQPPSSGTALIGLWESVQTSKGGIGHTIEFKDDGGVVQAITVLVDLVYRVQNDKLFTAADPAALEDLKDGTSFKIDDDTLVQSSLDGSSIRKQRIEGGELGSASIVGNWRYRHYTGAIAFERYTADGSLLFRLPMTSTSGCYVPGETAVTLVRPDNAPAVITYRVQGDRLELTREGKDVVYRRSTGGAWYPRDQIDYKRP